MPRFKNKNQMLFVKWKRLARGEAHFLLAAVPSEDRRRYLIHVAVHDQCEADGKVGWSMDQKFNDAPWRYGRDEFTASLLSISNRLSASNPSIAFGTGGDFHHPTIKSWADFVNGQLTKSVSSLINEIMAASRWA